MKIRTFLVLALATVCGLSAVTGVNRLLQMGGNGKDKGTVPVVTVTESVPRGSMLSPGILEVKHWPKDKAPEGVIGSVDEVASRCVVVSLVKSEPVLEGKLAAKDAGYGLAAMIPRGMRAFTIRTPNEATGVGGFILPGNKVDVLLTTSGSGSRDTTGGGATTTLLQNVEILAVDQRLDPPDANKVDPKEMKSVTLLVTPDQAAKLDLGMNKGLLHLSLRNSEDHAEADTKPATMAELRFSQERPIVQAPPTFKLEDTPGDVVAAAFVSPSLPAISHSVAKPSRPRRGEIRTIRGSDQGSVQIEF